MGIIALETDSVTPKTPDNTHLMFYEKHKKKHPKCMTSFGVHFGILPKKRLPTVASVATQLESF